MVAPSYIAGIVAILVGAQSLLGLDFAPEMWTSAIMVIMGVFVAVRQILTKRSTLIGGRPEGFNA